MTGLSAPTPVGHRDVNTDEVMRPTVRAVGPVACDLLPERIDALIKVQSAQHSAMLAEIGHMRGDIKDLTVAVNRLADALQPIVQDKLDQRAVDKARSELHQKQETVNEALVSFINSPTTKAVIAALIAAFGAMGLLRSCGLVEMPPEPQEAHADGSFWRGR